MVIFVFLYLHYRPLGSRGRHPRHPAAGGAGAGGPGTAGAGAPAPAARLLPDLPAGLPARHHSLRLHPPAGERHAPQPGPGAGAAAGDYCFILLHVLDCFLLSP
jgi:hypothetical protein